MALSLSIDSSVSCDSTCRRKSNITAADGLFDFLDLKRDRDNLPEETTDALCCMAHSHGQCWQIGTPDLMHYLKEVHCRGEAIEQGWVTWHISELGLPTPFGSPPSQGQLLNFLSSLVGVSRIHEIALAMYV